MTSGERSSLEHSGMPLRFALNAGRVRRQEPPSLETFSIKRASVVDRTLGERFIDAPEPVDDEEQKGVTLSGTKPKQNLNNGESFGAPHPFSGSGAPSAASSESQENVQSTASSFTAPERPYGVRTTPASLQQDSTHSGPKSIGSTASGARLQSHVLVQKIVNDAVSSPFPFASMTSSPQRETNDANPSWTFTPVTEMPMQYMAAGEMDISYPRHIGQSPWQTGRDNTRTGPIADLQTFSGWEARLAAADLQTFSGLEARSAAPENKPSVTAGQQELLERLGQHEVSPKRVHIGNLHIKVQRAGAPTTAQVAAPQQNGPSQEATMALQTFINPWDRHWTVFD